MGSVRTVFYVDEKGIKPYTFDVYDDRLEFVECRHSSSASAQDEEYVPDDDDLPFV